MTTTWRPSEIIIHNSVVDDPITQNILRLCPNVPIESVDKSSPNVVKDASNILSAISDEASVQGRIVTGKRVLYVSPAGNDVVKPFEFEEDRMVCPEFEKLILTSNGCYYNCDWCFLKSTYRANQNYITVRVEYDAIKEQILKVLKTASPPVMFNTGEMGDSLSLEHLTGAAREFIPWFAEQANGYMYMLTKSDNVRSILNLEHKGHTVLAWSINSALVAHQFETGASKVVDRLRAARDAQAAGYPVRIRLDPIVPVKDWKRLYSEEIKAIFDYVKPERITLGTLRFEPALYNQRSSYFTPRLVKLLDSLEIQPMLDKAKLDSGKQSVGKYSFTPETRSEIFQFAINEIRKHSECDIALCKETHDVWQAVGLNPAQCKCVCKYGSVDMSIKPEEVSEMTTTKKTKSKPAAKPKKSDASKPAEPEVDRKKSTEEYKTRELYDLDIELLSPDPEQPRKTFDDEELKVLASSIKRHGVLQPILFRKNEDGYLIIVTGERRYQASLIENQTTIPAICTEGKPSEIALVENLLRVDLSSIEEAEALYRLSVDENYTNKLLASVIGKAESTVSELLSINKIPQKLRDLYRSNRKLSKRILVEVAKADESKMKTMLKKAAANELNRDEARAEVQKRTREVDAVFKAMVGGLKTRLNDTIIADLDDAKKQQIISELDGLLVVLHAKLGELRG